MRPIWAVMTALAMLAVCSLALVPGAHAAIDQSSYGHVYLLNDGGDAISESTDWRVYVEVPSGLYVSAESWEFRTYAEYLGDVGGVDATLAITMTIDDGVSAPLTRTATINAVAEEGKQEEMITFSAPSLEATKDATWTVSLTVDAVEADSASGTCEILESKETATIVAMMPMIMRVIVAAGLIGVLGAMLRKIRI